MKVSLLIVAASARWLAESARRCGIRFLAADLFGDWDTCRAGSVVKLHRLADWVDLLKSIEFTQLLLGGGMENHWETLADLDPRIRVCGWSPQAISASRRPEYWNGALSKRGIKVPEFRTCASNVATGRWLLKPLRSGGGRAIECWASGTPIPQGFFLQEQLAGTDASALYLAEQGRVHLVGACRQLIGTPELGARGFQFAGVVGPLPIDSNAIDRLTAIGGAIGTEFGARGLFGVDFILTDAGPIPVEINPRPTASAELFQRIGYGNLFAWHWEACRETRFEHLSRELEHLRRASIGDKQVRMAKGVVYWVNHCDLYVRPQVHALLQAEWLSQRIADIPAVGARVEIGQPFVSVFARGATCDDAVQDLIEYSKAFIERIECCRSANAAADDSEEAGVAAGSRAPPH